MAITKELAGHSGQGGLKVGLLEEAAVTLNDGLAGIVDLLESLEARLLGGNPPEALANAVAPARWGGHVGKLEDAIRKNDEDRSRAIAILARLAAAL